MKMPAALAPLLVALRQRRAMIVAGVFALLVGAALSGATLLNSAPSRAAVESAACERRTFEGSIFTVCAFDSRRQEFRLIWTGANGQPLRSFSLLDDDLGHESARVRFAMNAGMFNARGAPIGLFVARGKARHRISTGDGPGNFHMKPNGVFSLDQDGAVHVESTDAYAARDAHPMWATQSGPMLVINGSLHPALQDDGASRNVRNGVGRLDEHTALFVISEAPVSFGRLARLFRDDLKCADALYFDGAVSSLWQPGAERMDSGFALGPMAVVLARK